MADQKRSPNYPAVDLAEAIRLAKLIWDKEKRTAVAPEVLVGAWDYKGLSGPGRTKIGALKKYGLLEDQDHGLRISDLAMRIIHSDEGSDERLAGIREAATKPELFKELLKTHPDASEGAIKSYLVLNKEFSDAGATLCAGAFKAALSLAKLNGSGYSGEEQEKDKVPESQLGTTHLKTPPTSTKPNALVTQTLAPSIPRNLS